MKQYFQPGLVTFLGLLASSTAFSADLTDEIKGQIAAKKADVESGMDSLSKNLTAAFAHRSLAPADTLGGGVGGFEIGVDMNLVEFDSTAITKIAGSADSDFDVSSLPLLKVSAGVGLPALPIDLNAGYMSVDGVFSVFSAEVKYAVIKGSTVMPAVSVSGNYASAELAGALSTTTMGVDAAISKGFGVGVKVIPFAGAGYVMGTTTISDAATGGADIKKSYDANATKLFAGASLQLALLNLVYQMDTVGDYATQSVRVGFRF